MCIFSYLDNPEAVLGGGSGFVADIQWPTFGFDSYTLLLVQSRSHNEGSQWLLPHKVHLAQFRS